MAEAGLSDVDKAELNNLGECVHGMYSDPAYAPLTTKMPSEPTAASDAQLNDQTKVTDEQVHAIFATHPLQSACQDAAINVIARDNPRLAEELAVYSGISSFALHKLAFHQTTWGQFNQGRMRDAFMAARRISTPPKPPVRSDDEIRRALADDMRFNGEIDSQFENAAIHAQPPGLIR